MCEDGIIKVVEPDEPVDHCYGLEVLKLSIDHIIALECGKKLYTTINAGEYAILIEFN